MPKNQKSMTNSLHPPAALRLRVLHSQGKAPTVCSVFPMKLPGSSFFPMDLRYAAASISATAPPLCRRSAMAPRPAASSRWCSIDSHAWSPAERQLFRTDFRFAPSLPQRRISAYSRLPQHPGQQQTSSGGEKYSGLASNLAHLGRIC